MPFSRRTSWYVSARALHVSRSAVSRATALSRCATCSCLRLRLFRAASVFCRRFHWICSCSVAPGGGGGPGDSSLSSSSSATLRERRRLCDGPGVGCGGAGGALGEGRSAGGCGWCDESAECKLPDAKSGER
jgi:hypothetical protein